MGCDCAGPLGEIKGSIDETKQQIEQTARDHISAEKPIDETFYGSELKGSAAGGETTGPGNGKGVHGAIGSLRFCNWAAPEYGPIGEGNWTNFFRAAALAIAIANGVAQSQIADMQQDLADSYYDMAKYKWDRFYQKFVPLEKKLLNEVLNEPLKEMDCADDRQRADGWVGRAYGAMSSWMRTKARQMRVCMDALDRRRPAIAQTLALADTANYNYVDDRWFCDYSNDKRWNRRSSVLNLGRNLGSEALKYGDVARSLLNTVSGQIEQAANGLINAMGYYGARLDTYYPSSYLGQSQGNIANIGQSVGYGSQQLLGFPGQMGA
jgi:hypothetical protein